MRLVPSLPTFVVLASLVAIAAAAAAEPATAEQATFEKLLTATQENNFQAFIAPGDEQMRAMPQAEFDKATKKFSPLLKAGYHSTYLGSFKDQGFTVHYWKLEFAGEPHDWLAKMAVGGGKVKGFFITRP